MARPSEGKLERATEYILAHPHETKKQQATGSGVSESHVAKARRLLIADGQLAPSRKAPHSTVPQIQDEKKGDAPAPPTVLAPGLKGGSLRDHEAMVALAELSDKIDIMAPEEVLRRLSKQCLMFAFDQSLHVDTRMSAGQQWMKLRDAQRAKDLGMGVPVTREAAVARLAEMQFACGPGVTFEAVMAAPQDFRITLLTKIVEAFDANDHEAPASVDPPTTAGKA